MCVAEVLFSCIFMIFKQVVNRLRKEHVYETLLNYGINYDKTWIYDKIHHEINQFCSAHSMQQVYIDMFDQVTTYRPCLILDGYPSYLKAVSSSFLIL